MKKGFTLVELLAIIVILGILGTISTAIYTNVQNKAKDTLYKEQLDTIERTIRRYITENEGKTVNINGNNVKLDIYTENNSFQLPMSFLLSEEYLDVIPTNPKCNKKMEGYWQLTVTTPGTYKLEYKMSNTEETFCKV